MTGEAFAQALARELDLPALEAAEIASLLRLASTAAHASERLAAPLCTYLAGQAGRPLDEIHAAMERVVATAGDATS